jgi:hypothetical protein
MNWKAIIERIIANIIGGLIFYALYHYLGR